MLAFQLKASSSAGLRKAVEVGTNLEAGEVVKLAILNQLEMGPSLLFYRVISWFYLCPLEPQYF